LLSEANSNGIGMPQGRQIVIPQRRLAIFRRHSRAVHT
jgi:hypothetical protein